jgi:hypothetical protein
LDKRWRPWFSCHEWIWPLKNAQCFNQLYVHTYAKVSHQVKTAWSLSVVVYFTVTAFRRLRQEDHEVEASQAYIRRPCLKKQRNKQTKQHKPSDII